MVVRSLEREKWIQANPETYFITEHYRNYPSMLIRLAKAEPVDLEQLLITAWLSRATKALIKEYQNND